MGYDIGCKWPMKKVRWAPVGCSCVDRWMEIEMNGELEIIRPRSLEKVPDGGRARRRGINCRRRRRWKLRGRKHVHIENHSRAVFLLELNGAIANANELTDPASWSRRRETMHEQKRVKWNKNWKFCTDSKTNSSDLTAKSRPAYLNKHEHTYSCE